MTLFTSLIRNISERSSSENKIPEIYKKLGETKKTVAKASVLNLWITSKHSDSKIRENPKWRAEKTDLEEGKVKGRAERKK